MPSTIELCSTCSAIFLVAHGNESITYDSDEFKYHDHHETLEALRDAVKQGCYICSKAWSHFGNDTRNRWISDERSWTPLKYNLAVKETVVFSIRWSSTYLAYTVPARCHLMKVSGECIAISAPRLQQQRK
jgi:hypothetical protein